jgi:hypothetical protein
LPHDFDDTLDFSISLAGRGMIDKSRIAKGQTTGFLRGAIE